MRNSRWADTQQVRETSATVHATGSFIHRDQCGGKLCFTDHLEQMEPTISWRVCFSWTFSKAGRNLLDRFLQRSYSKECCKFLWGVFSVKIIILPQTLPDVQESVPECVPSPPLPADHVLNSGAVLFPGSYSSTLLCLLDNVFYVQQWLILHSVASLAGIRQF